MKNMKKMLSLLLALCMVLSVLPMSAFAAEEDADTSVVEEVPAEETPAEEEEISLQATDSEKYRIVMLDCGRKYFSVDNVKKLIDTMARCGYNQLTLAFSNGGCRFLLDDMSLSFGGVNMASDTVKNNITAGNNEFNSDTRYWSQSDMDTIIAYAASKRIEIVPLLNMPGHATAILHNTNYASNGNLNVNNETSRNYGYALLKKYVDYFKNKGCNYFHFGADESGFSGSDMSTFLQGCADVITEAGMTPRMFNDPADGTNTIPTGVQITYWYQDSHQSASKLADNGYSLINTHGRWYYVIKTAQNSEINEKYWQGTVNSTETSVELPVMKQGSWGWIDIDTFFDNSYSIISNNLGTMFCIWCDASQDTYLTDSQVLSDNENYGALYQLEKMAEHYWPGDVKEESSEGSGDGSSGGSTGETNGGTVDVKLNVGNSKTYEDVTADAGSYITDDKYIATAEVKVTEAVTETTVSTEKATTLEAGASYILRVHDTIYALTSNTGRTDWKTQTLAFEEYTGVENDNVWTLEASGDGYKLKSAAGYLNLGTDNNTAYVSTTGEVFTLTYTATGWTVKNPSGEYINALGGLTYYYSAGGWTGDDTRFDLYKVNEETEASTTLTITGTGEGTTTAIIGDTTYNITVTAPSVTETKKLSLNGTLTLPDGAKDVKIDGTVVTNEDGKLTAGDAEGEATVTFTTVNDGNKVTGHYTYKISVIAVDLSDVATFDVQLWCTNTPIGKDGNSVTEKWNGLSIVLSGTATVCTPATMSISAADAYGEDGVLLKDFVLATGVSFTNDGTYQEERAYVYWKGVALHDGDTQGHSNADSNKEDKSDEGTIFYKIRYWNDQWEYLASDTSEWTAVKSDDTCIAYYLQKFVPSDEVAAMTRDWGAIAGNGGGEDSGPFSWWSAPTGYIGIGSAVVYNDKSMSPVDDQGIWDETLQLRYVYGEGSTPGTIYIDETADFTITKVTITRGYHADSDGNRITAEKTVWDSEDQVLWDRVTNSAGDTWYDETVIWETGDVVDPVTGRICLDATTWGDTWVTQTGNNEAFLILVYVEPVVRESSLKVVYWDDATNNQINPTDLYITVNDGTTFLDIQQTSDVNVGTFTLDDDAYIINIANNKRNFNKNITIIDGVDDNYKSGIYYYVSADISEDAKTLTLHYNIKEAPVKKQYVVDFGLPLVITDVLSNVSNVTDFSTIKYFGVSVNGGLTGGNIGTYGDIVMETQVNGDYTITYNLKKILTTSVIIPVYYTINGTEQTYTYIEVYPATSVFYEENFLEYTGSWTDEGNKVPGNQATEELGKHTNNFGRDGAYAEVSTGSYKESNTTGDSATFTFTGTGFQIYANSTKDSGYVTVSNAENGTVQKVYLINTALTPGTSDATNKQDGDTYYSLPIVSETALPHGTYTVTLYNTRGDTIMIDGVRILGTMEDSTIYTDDLEDNPTFYELRDYVLKAIGVDNVEGSTYGEVKDLAGQVYNNVGEANSAIVIDSTPDAYKDNAQDLLDNGPKNELFLYAGQTLVFKVKTSRVMQLGLKAPTGNAEFTLKVNGTQVDNLTSLTSCVDMFYKIAGKASTETEYTVTITVKEGSGVLSVTLLKICDDPNASFAALTQEDIEAALLGIYNVTPEETPVEPTDPEPTDPETTDPEPTEPVTPTDPEIPTDPVTPTDPEVPTDPVTPTEPETPVEPETRTTTLTITYVNLLGRKVGTATLTLEVPVGEKATFSATSIRGAAPGRRTAIWLFPVTVAAGGTQSIVVPVI